MPESDSTSRGDAVESATGRLVGLRGKNLGVIGAEMVGKSTFAVEALEAATGAGRDAMLVTSTRSPGRLLGRMPGRDGRIGIVDCSPGSSGAVGDKVTDVGSPGDLTGLGMPISEFLSSVERPVLVFDSVSTLVMYSDQPAVFKFLSVIATQVRRADGLGLFTFAAESGEEGTRPTFQQLFDGRVELRREAGNREALVEGVNGTPDRWLGY